MIKYKKNSSLIVHDIEVTISDDNFASYKYYYNRLYIKIIFFFHLNLFSC